MKPADRPPAAFEVGLLSGPDEIPALAPILASGFGFPAADAPGWIERAGLENVRVVRERGALVGALLLLPMGQWFGGRRLPMTGLAAVTVSPQHRGRGAAAVLLRAALGEMRAAGVPLSTLFPSTVPVYRKLGWEVAGSRWEMHLPLSSLALRPLDDPRIDAGAAALHVRPVTPEDAPAIAAAHRLRAARTTGWLDRNDYMWARVHHPTREQEAQGFVAERDGRIEGWFFAVNKRSDRLRFDLRLTDFVALGPAAARRLLTLLAGWRSIAEDAIFHGAFEDPILAQLDDYRSHVHLWMSWMLRLVDVQAAFAGRGFPEEARGELHLDVRDDVLPENAGRWLLAVEGGRAELRRGGEGRLRLQVGPLAVVYTGYCSPADLAAAGLLEGSDPDLRLAAALFAGPAPSMPDHF